MKQRRGFEKPRPIEAIVSGKVYPEDLEILRANRVNVSELIRHAVREEAKKYQKPKP